MHALSLLLVLQSWELFQQASERKLDFENGNYFLFSSLYKCKLKIRVSCASSIWFELENMVFSLFLKAMDFLRGLCLKTLSSCHFHHTMPPFHFFQIARSSFIYSLVTNLRLLLRFLFHILSVLHYANSRKSFLIVQKLFFPRTLSAPL